MLASIDNGLMNTTEPLQILAGDTLTWTKTLADYPATEFTLKYRIINAAGHFDITASASGSDHLILVKAATTVGYTPGIYTWTSFVEKGAGAELERYTIAQGTISVGPSLSTQSAGLDTRSDVKIALDNMTAIIKNVREVGSYSINGRTYTSHDLTFLVKTWNQLKTEYAAELSAEKIAQGMGSGRRILTRFV